YMNTPIFSLADPSIDSNTWFEMNIFETYDQMGIDIRPLMDLNTQEETSISQMMQLALLGMNQGDVNSFNNMKIGYALLKNLIGDEAFSSYRSGSITTNSLKLNKNSIYSAIEKVLLQEDLGSVQIDALQIISALKELKLNSNIVIKTKNDKLYDYTMGYDVAFDDFYMRLDMSGDTLSSKVDMEFEHPLFTKMKLKSNSKYTETSKSPDLSLPKDAKVLDYNTYFMPQI
ncbi:MAG TPA: hypothetical protein VFC96_07530, partial [Anaerovoracaceae bacterium]|nr:hypothetical protein [Anaerovoracaceae bacterium]